MKNFNYFIGIDQTGAVDAKGRPKKLHACIYNKKQNLFSFCFLDQLSWQQISNYLPANAQKEEVFILIDSVFGLPKKAKHLNKSIRNLFLMAKNYQFEKKPFGLLTAYNFFNQFKPQNKTIPKRKAEIIAGANSLFLLHPFQKNISCGTYRIWKELSYDPSWYQVWPFENHQKNKVYIAEGYPSYYWNKLFNLKTRDTDLLLRTLHKNILKQIISHKAQLSKDSIDAFVLAYSAAKILEDTLFFDKSFKSIEGWILGVGH